MRILLWPTRNGTCLRIEHNNRAQISSLLTPEEAVEFGTKLINIAYPLTKAVQKRTLPDKPNEYQGGFCSHYKSGRR